MYSKTLISLVIATLAVIALIGFVNTDASSTMLRKEKKPSVGGVMAWYSGDSGAAACNTACAKIGGTPCGKYAVSCCASGQCSSSWYGGSTCGSRLNGDC